MLSGMTGFGRAQARYNKIHLTLQMASVNHRFFEVVFHIPENLICLEEKIKHYLHKRLKRGRIIFNLSVSGNISGKVSLDKELAKEYFQAIRTLRKELSLTEEISLPQLSAMPGVLSLAESRLPEELIWPKIEKLLTAACDNLCGMRFAEGRAIEKDVLARLDKINTKLLFIKRKIPVVIARKCKRLENNGVSSEEINAAVRNCDISEEVTRLAFHLKSFAAKIKNNRKCPPLGKELDFVTQEMQREANTMGAKAQDVYLSAAVIEIKSQIEKIREQIQNAE